MRRIGSLLCIILALALTMPVSASEPEAITIQTSRLSGSPGTFSISGAISDVGEFTTLGINLSASGAPTFLVVHATYLFVGGHGSFTLHTDIKETLTADPNVLSGEGTWVILDGTGDYVNLRGQGTVHGTTDDNHVPALITRTFEGQVHFD